MPIDSPRFDHALALIDAANGRDPNRANFEGREYPAELIYSMRMSEWLDRLEPTASEALRLAVRCQHLRRWEVPRSQFPMTRPGYLHWRTKLSAFHAESAAGILREAGYDEPAIARVKSLIRKERIKNDAEAQTLEDVACLVFLEQDYVDFASRHEEAKIIDILRKTWRKMSDRGHAAAIKLATTLPEEWRVLIERALAK